MTDELTADQITAAVEAIVVIDEQIAQLRDAREALAQPLRALGPGNYGAGAHTVQIQSSRRLSERRFTAVYPPADHPDLYRPAPDLVEIRRRIADVDLTDFYDVSTRMVIK